MFNPNTIFTEEEKKDKNAMRRVNSDAQHGGGGGDFIQRNVNLANFI